VNCRFTWQDIFWKTYSDISSTKNVLQKHFIYIWSACSLVYLTFLPHFTVDQYAAYLTCLRKADWYQAYSNQQGNRFCLTNKFSRGLSTLALDFLRNGAVLNIRKHCWPMLLSCTVQSRNYRFISKYRVFQQERKINFVINTPFIQKVLIFLFQYKVHIIRLWNTISDKCLPRLCWVMGDDNACTLNLAFLLGHPIVVHSYWNFIVMTVIMYTHT
jgi:hypothetical protein